MLPLREAREGVRSEIGTLIQETLKALFEAKHLYQSMKVDLTSLVARASGLKADIERFAQGPWQVADPGGPVYLHPRSSGGFTGETTQIFGPIAFNAPRGIKIFCLRCGGREAFSPMRVAEVSLFETTTVDFGQEYRPSDDAALALQVFMLAYICQRCEGEPEVFLVRRESLKLLLCGRAPMEHIEIPREIPREVEKWYRDALIAYQSGKTLAGLLYLRTVIEQWARQVTKSIVPNGDQLLSAYMETLPRVITDNFTSMRDLYAQISEPLHAATEDAALFEEAREKIHRHFRARDLYKEQARGTR